MGVIYDGRNFHAAPIFDNGKSLLVGLILSESPTADLLEQSIRKCYAKAFSPSYEINYKYLRDVTDIKLDVNKLNGLLNKVEDCFQKQVLMHQLNTLQFL